MRVKEMCKKISTILNGIITGDKGLPLCYTAYKSKSRWYKVFNKIFFWERNHCRKAYLSRRIQSNMGKLDE